MKPRKYVSGAKPRTDALCLKVLNAYVIYGRVAAAAARSLDMATTTFKDILNEALSRKIDPTVEIPADDEPEPEPKIIMPKYPQAQWIGGPIVEIFSRPDNTYLFGACGDQHVASKYFRADVLSNLYARYDNASVQAVFNTGNWIDGEASFNRYDITAHGLDRQCRELAAVYPRCDFPTYAVWGDDHEGWYAQREGIDVGKYAESVMRSAGHDWHDLGFMEAHVKLTNANTGKYAVLSVVHPGGGSAYALSYTIQKIVESLEGGEKPAVGLYGHYHKLWSGNVRNVWCAQTGTTQDQTPFMRKKRLEAHVGGMLIGLEQDPNTGAIIGFTPTMWRYFNKAYYQANDRWSKHGDVTQMPRSIGGL